LATSSLDESTRVWDLTGSRPKEQLILKTSSWVTTVSLSPRGDLLATSTSKGTLHIHSMNGSREKLPAQYSDFSGPMAFTSDNESLLGVWEGNVKLWKSGGAIRTFSFEKTLAPWARVALSPDGGTFASAARKTGRDDDGNTYLQMWDRQGSRWEKRPLVQLSIDPTRIATVLALSAGGRVIALGYPGGCHLVHLHANGATREIPLEGELGESPLVALAPDGRTVAATDRTSETLLVWDTKAGKQLHQWKVPDLMRRIAFAPDSRHLAVGNANGIVYIFRLAERLDK
jgi:WD40 repeat protein